MIRTWLRRRLGLVAVLGILCAAPAMAQQKPVTRPTTAIESTSCVTAECHASVKATPVLHGPVAGDSCEGCHELVSAEKHTFRVTREKSDLCTFCHEFSVEKMPVVHKPVAEGECLGCHNPHGGTSRGLLREGSVQAMCDSCHANVSHDKAFVHAPVTEGKCDSCHPPHAAMFPKLLDAVGSDLCLACHKEFEPAMAGATSVHEAMKDGCDRCHDPHASNAPMILHKETSELCIECHQDIQKKMTTAKVPHSAATDGRACMNCHAPHASNVGQLLSEKPVDACLRCHDKAVTAKDGTKIAGVKDLADPRLVKHGEIRDGFCSGCHEVHGAELASLLKQPYTTEFYQQFSPEDQALCFGCHNVRLAQTEKTDTLTAFRNGNQNLHFVHANQGSRDKNCGACHATHTSPNERIVRSTVAFGKWNMPMRFSKTETGGSCLPGCHREYAYDREQAVAYDAPMPSEGHAGVNAIKRDVSKIQWRAQDIGGKPVVVPHPEGKPTALVVVWSEDQGLSQLLGHLKTIITPETSGQVAILISGPTAREKAKGLAGELQWPIVADPDSEMTGALGVRGMPLVLVLRGDGIELARVSGASEFLAIKLMPYLQLASGQIDEETAKRVLHGGPVEEIDAKGRAARDLRTARSLLDLKRYDEAMVILGRTESVAGMPEAQLMRAEALLRLKRVEEAIATLERLSGPADMTQVRLLRADAMMQQERWSGARELLGEVLKEAPTNVQANRLMAQLYEREQNWEKATEHYRIADEASRAR